MGAEKPIAYPQPAARSAEVTGRLAWVILVATVLCCMAACVLSVMGVLRLRATIRTWRNDNTMAALTNAVAWAEVGEVRFATVSPGAQAPLRVGESVRVDPSAGPGANALITLWDGSTIQLYAGARLTLNHLQTTRYSDLAADFELQLDSGSAVIGVAQVNHYEEVRFVVQTPAAQVELDPGGTYFFRIEEESTELAVRSGEAVVTKKESNLVFQVTSGNRILAHLYQPTELAPASWSLLENGDFAEGGDHWSFVSEQWGGGDSRTEAEFRIETQKIDGDWAKVAIIERIRGQENRGQGALIQKIGQDVSMYDSVRLNVDVMLREQSLAGGGLFGEDYPFNIRVVYHDAQGEKREYTFGYYFLEQEGFPTEFPGPGKTEKLRHFQWEPLSEELRWLPGGVAMIDEVRLSSSGNNYRIWFKNISLVASIGER